MKAEIDFINSLPDDVAINITNAGIKRFNKTKETSVKPIRAKPSELKESCVGTVYSQNNVSLSTLQCAGYYIPTTTTEVPQQKGQKEDAMSDLDTARRHMDTRLWSIKRNKRDALKTQFGLADQARPETFAEMTTRLKAGMFTLPTDDEDNAYGVCLDSLEWRDPAVKKDRPGFEAAEKLLDAAYVKVKDAIWVKANAEDALALLEAFESATVN